jgi:hypothetical protein
LSALEVTSGSNITRLSALETASGSAITRLGALEVTSGSNITRLGALETASGSAITRLSNIESKTGSYATTGSNTFVDGQYLSSSFNPTGFSTTASLYTDGGLRVTRDAYISGTLYLNNVTVFGTQSVAYISSSQLNIGTNLITVNTDTPSIRFGGLSVYDSGSTGLTGSILWDSQNNHWVYSNPSGSSYSGGMFISGPRTSTLGSETGTTSCALMMGQGGDHITSSAIFHYGNATCFYGNSFISSSGDACFSGQVCSNTLATAASLTVGSGLNVTSFISSSGNFRIDKDQPEIQLNISSADLFSRIYFFEGSSGNGGVQLIGSSFTGARKCRFEIFGNNAGMSFIANGQFENPGMFITGSNVGIGTISPAYTLDVNGTGGFCGNVTISRNSNTLTRLITSNTTAGTSAYVETTFISDTSSGASAIGKYSSATNTYKIITASNTFLYNNTVAGDIAILNDFASGAIKMAAGGSCTSHLTIASNGISCFSNTICAKSLWFSSNSTGQITFGANDACNAYVVSDTNNSLFLGNNNSYKILVPNDGTDMIFRTSQTYGNPEERVRLNRFGQLLINASCSTYSSNLFGYNLGVRGTNNQTFISIARANQALDSQGIIFGLDTTQASLFVFDDIPLVFATNTTERMRITSGGNIGIGTNNPGAKLDICQLGGDSARTCHALYLRAGNNSDVFNSNQILFSYNGGTDYAHAIKTRHNSNNAIDNAIDFYTWNFGDAAATKAGRYVMTIAGNGNVGIGSCQPAKPLSVWPSGGIGVYSNNTYSPSISLDFNNGTNIGHLLADQNAYYIRTLTSYPIYIQANAANGVYLSVGATSFTGNSDERLKNINSNIESAIDKLSTLRAVNFSWKSDDTNKENLGLIAQDVEQVFPQIVDKIKMPSKVDEEQTDETEYLGVRYTELIPVLVKAIQELKAENDTFKTCLGII